MASQLKNIIKQSKSKKDLVIKLSQEDPEYLIEHLNNIERVADIIYKKDLKRKKQEQSSDDDDDSSSEEEQVIKKQKKPNNYNEFIKRESKNLVDVDNKDKFRVLAEMWKTSRENPKNI